mmetsp:Transcript_49943/g.117414  ORF Transcript_49943/g.117414 Transcript_49943/m.117414 type:complete len:83 (-) Transcript_49943:419-667(-)
MGCTADDEPGAEEGPGLGAGPPHAGGSAPDSPLVQQAAQLVASPVGYLTVPAAEDEVNPAVPPVPHAVKPSEQVAPGGQHPL